MLMNYNIFLDDKHFITTFYVILPKSCISPQEIDKMNNNNKKIL